MVTFQLPTRAFRTAMARSVWKELTKLEVRQPLCASACGAAAANSRAMRRIVSAGMPVIGAAHSGVYCCTSCASSSKPTVYCSTNAWSYSSSPMMTFSSARWKARSVPGLMGSHSVALAAVLVKRGSR